MVLTWAHVNARTVTGIDVSHHQGHIDWKKVAAADIDFVYVKATEGATYTIWQYTESGRVNGIPKPVDKCRFNSKYMVRDIMRDKK